MSLLCESFLIHVLEEFTSPCALPRTSRALMPLGHQGIVTLATCDTSSMVHGRG